MKNNEKSARSHPRLRKNASRLLAPPTTITTTTASPADSSSPCARTFFMCLETTRLTHGKTCASPQCDATHQASRPLLRSQTPFGFRYRVTSALDALEGSPPAQRPSGHPTTAGVHLRSALTSNSSRVGPEDLATHQAPLLHGIALTSPADVLLSSLSSDS